MSSLQDRDGQRFSLIWASYSSRKYLRVDKNGLGALLPRAQREASTAVSASSSRSSISPSLPLPWVILVSILCIWRRPSRQGTHLPQDSSVRKAIKYLATSTMQVSSSMAIIPPEPIMEPALVSSSNPTCRSSLSSGMHPPEAPPAWTALNFLPPGMPPPMVKMISRRVVPMGTSTSPVLVILPTREKILVPLLDSVPMEVNQSAPLLMIMGTLAQVSTLLRTDGLSQRPLTLERTYLGRGSPAFPSREAMRAVDSPQTKAPAPWCTWTLKLKPETRMFSPRSPYFSASLMAWLILMTAR